MVLAQFHNGKYKVIRLFDKSACAIFSINCSKTPKSHFDSIPVITFNNFMKLKIMFLSET